MAGKVRILILGLLAIASAWGQASIGGGAPVVVVSTAGPVADPGGAYVMFVNNSAQGYVGIASGFGGITFLSPAPTPGMQRIYRQASGGYPNANLGGGPIIIQMPVGTSVDLAGQNNGNPANYGTTLAAPVLISAGAAGESIYLWCDVAGHWMASVWSGTWQIGPPPPLPVQNPTGVWSTGTTYTVTIAAAGAGNTLGCFIGTNNVAVSGVTGGGVTWAKQVSSDTNRDVELWMGPNSSGSGTTITITLASAPTSSGASCFELPINVATLTLDGSATTHAATGIHPAATASVTSNAWDILLSGIMTAGTLSGGVCTSSGSNSGTYVCLAIPSGIPLAAAFGAVYATGSYVFAAATSSALYDAIQAAIEF